MAPNVQLTHCLPGCREDMDIHGTLPIASCYLNLIGTCVFFCPEDTSCIGWKCCFSQNTNKHNLGWQHSSQGTQLTHSPVSPIDVVAKHSHGKWMDDGVHNDLPIVALQIRTLDFVPANKFHVWPQYHIGGGFCCMKGHYRFAKLTFGHRPSTVYARHSLSSVHLASPGLRAPGWFCCVQPDWPFQSVVRGPSLWSTCDCNAQSQRHLVISLDVKFIKNLRQPRCTRLGSAIQCCQCKDWVVVFTRTVHQFAKVLLHTTNTAIYCFQL